MPTRHSFGSALTYALTTAKPTLPNGIVLTDFSLNSSFIINIHVGANFEQAYLNQPFRFGGLPALKVQKITPVLGRLDDLLEDYDLINLIAGIAPPGKPAKYRPGYLTNANADASQFLFPGHFDLGTVQSAEQTKQSIAPGEILTTGSGLTLSAITGPVLVVTGCKSKSFKVLSIPKSADEQSKPATCPFAEATALLPEILQHRLSLQR